jgi:hypothetical protein
MERAIYSQLGGSMNVGFLSENHHKTDLIACEDHLLSEGVPLFVIISSIASLNIYISNKPQ